MKKIKYPELVGEMAKRGDTQESLAKLLGIPHSSISRRLSGEIEWSISEIDKLCEFYGKDYYELFKKND
jgi:transcriptional regulator with XRE-family HTH domain